MNRKLLVFISGTRKAIRNWNLTTPWSPSSEAKSTVSRQEIPRILWIPENHYRLHKNLPFVPILCQINPVLALPNDCFKIHSNIIHTFRPRSFKWSLPHRNPTFTSPLPCTCRNTNVKTKTKQVQRSGLTYQTISC